MANEITVTARLRATKGYLSVDRSVSKTSNMYGTHMSDNIQSIPTSAAGTAITITAGVASAGWAWVRNTDTTNYIDIGVQVSGTFYPLIRLYPGEGHPMRLAMLTPYARANTAAVDLEFCALES